MSIQELSSKFKGFLTNPEYQLSGLIIIVALASFGLGRVSQGTVTELQEIPNSAQVISTIEEETKEKTNTETAVTGKYVASKNGTKYHLPWCSGAKQMNEENKIWFDTKAAAEAAGYSPAANCKGI